MAVERFLVWQIDATDGFDAAWATIDGDRLSAAGQAVGQRPRPYSTTYELATGPAFTTARMRVASRWEGGRATLDLVRASDGSWSVNGEPRPDLDGALDCDLAGCPLTNTMPALRHDLLAKAGDHELLMAFIDLPELTVTPNWQRYSHVRRDASGDAIVTYRSGAFRSDITFDPDGFVRVYPQLGRRVDPSARDESA